MERNFAVEFLNVVLGHFDRRVLAGSITVERRQTSLRLKSSELCSSHQNTPDFKNSTTGRQRKILIECLDELVIYKPSGYGALRKILENY